MSNLTIEKKLAKHLKVSIDVIHNLVEKDKLTYGTTCGSLTFTVKDAEAWEVVEANQV